MATKRTSKKRPARKTASKQTKARKQSERGLRSALVKSLLLILGLGLLLALTYHFSPYSVRATMERIGLTTLNAARSPNWMPELATASLDWLHDRIPNSEGMVVDGGELGYNDSPFIAGVPTGKTPLRPLRNISSTNLFSERERQTALLATYLKAESEERVEAVSTLYDDPRIPTLKPAQLNMGKWTAQPLIPSEFLAKWHGQNGANEARLATNLVPMQRELAQGPWQELMELLAEDYPDRFGALWLYTGPAYRVQHAKLATGLPIPDGFYAIAFELTKDGGLRAIAFLIPHDNEVRQLSDCITSISQIEAITGLNFLPELDYAPRESLRNWVSPALW